MKTANRSFRALGPLAVALVLCGMAGCGGFSDKARFEQIDEVSGCSGFDTHIAPLKVPRQDPPPYCDANVLVWTYDASDGTLVLEDRRILLNCCGEHSMEMTFTDGVYQVLEIDAPEFGDARCSCMCVFDYRITAKGIPQEVIPVSIERLVTDWAEESGVVWEGELDLASADHGFELISDEDVGMWCGEITE